MNAGALHARRWSSAYGYIYGTEVETARAKEWITRFSEPGFFMASPVRAMKSVL